MKRRIALALLPLVPLVLLCCRAEGPAPAPVAASAALAPRLARGAELFEAHCAICHGSLGRGDGLASTYLFPPARDFTRGVFRLVSTTNGVPSNDDLMGTLRRGIPGSAMPPWEWMGDENLRALVAYVRRLAVQGLAEELGDPALAAERLEPGPRLPSVPASDATADALERGEQVFALRCALCHGMDGRGTEPIWSPSGALVWARDLRAGILKGGGSHDELSYRIRAGLPGSTMPASRFEDEAELADLIAYVQSIVPPDADERYVRRRGVLRALRGEYGDELAVLMAPLWWRTDATSEVLVSARHDGDSLFVRMRWRDETRDDRSLGGAPFPDAAAVQWSKEESPPLFGMGSQDHPTHLWHWRAADFAEVAGALDLYERPPHLATDAWLGGDYLRGATQGARGEDLRGPSTVGGAADPIDVEATWDDGWWTVSFRRELPEMAIAPGDEIQAAFAVWDGTAGDHRGYKQVSIWQRVRLDR